MHGEILEVWWEESGSSWYLFLETFFDDQWKASKEEKEEEQGEEPGSHASKIFRLIGRFVPVDR